MLWFKAIDKNKEIKVAENKLEEKIKLKVDNNHNQKF